MPAFADTKESADSIDQLVAKRPARRALWEAAQQIGEAATSARLYEQVKRQRTDIPRATFFRALKFLVDNGALRKAVLQDGNAVYQLATDSRHLLWVCDDCSRVLTLEASAVAEALREVAQDRGLSSQGMTVEVHGRCGCRN